MWRRAHQLTLQVYSASHVFPADEQYGLTSQLRRSAVSVCSNIAEGCGRSTDPDFARFIDISMGSASEMEYQLLLSMELGYLSNQAHRVLEAETIEVKRMLAGLLGRLRPQRKR